ncbi:hypothetical protein, partial [Pelagicoccus sp. SDUM812002]|uniref:hypothetical protein n=1 Tax=Pelagicoccus sp. SDUM812002 TaxID=3041266 RepID=UPI00281034D6
TQILHVVTSRIRKTKFSFVKMGRIDSLILQENSPTTLSSTTLSSTIIHCQKKNPDRTKLTGEKERKH